MNFYKPDNEWFVGLCYEYNKDQDKSRKEIKRLVDEGSFEKDEDYDDYGVSTIPIKVRYKHYTATNTFSESSQNQRKRTTAHTIETSDTTYKFKYKDRFKLIEQSDDESPYMIVNVDNAKNTQRKKASFLFPGLAEEYTPKRVLTLR